MFQKPTWVDAASWSVPQACATMCHMCGLHLAHLDIVCCLLSLAAHDPQSCYILHIKLTNPFGGMDFLLRIFEKVSQVAPCMFCVLSPHAIPMDHGIFELRMLSSVTKLPHACFMSFSLMQNQWVMPN